MEEIRKEISDWLLAQPDWLQEAAAFNHSPLKSLIFGSRTTEILRSATLPTLLLR